MEYEKWKIGIINQHMNVACHMQDLEKRLLPWWPWVLRLWMHPFMWSIGDMLLTSHFFVSYNFLVSNVLSNSILSSVFFHKRKWWIKNYIDIFGLCCLQISNVHVRVRVCFGICDGWHGVSAWLIYLLFYLMISQVVVAIQNLELLNCNVVNEKIILVYFLIMTWVANFWFVLKLLCS
jgi:hypothetical protein